MVKSVPHKTRLARLAHWLRPELNEFSGLMYSMRLINTYTLINNAPLALLGLLWLAWRTDVRAVPAAWPAYLLFLGLYLIFEALNFELRVTLRGGISGSIDGSLSGLIYYAAVLLEGPTVIWVFVAAEVGRFVLHLARNRQPTMRWVYAGNLVLSLSTTTFAGLTALAIAELLGSTVPFGTLEPAGLLAPLLGAVAGLVVPTLLLAPLLWLLARTPGLDEDGHSGGRQFMRIIILSTLFSGLAWPFAILAAALYTLHGPTIFLFFVTGALLASLLATRLSRAVARIAQRSRELAALEQLGRAIIDAPPTTEALPDLLTTHIAGMLPGSRGEIWLWPDRVLCRLVPESELPDRSRARAALEADPSAPWQLIPDILVPHESGGRGRRQGVAAPIVDDAGTARGGVYILLPSGERRPADFVPALQSLAAQIAAALDRATAYTQALANERMGQELAVAGRIQQSFLPAAVPQPAGYTLAARLIPARETSGDFYDFIPLDDGRLGLVVADVADKGTGAALYMALSRTLLRTYALQLPDAPEAALAAANERILADTQAEQFVTIFFGVLDLATGRLVYANAGHNPGFLLAPGSTPLALRRSGPPVGVLPGLSWGRAETTLPAGALLALYSDGVTEAQNDAHGEYGEERLLAALSIGTDRPVSDVVNQVVDDIDAFVDGAPQFDDITMLLLRRVP